MHSRVSARPTLAAAALQQYSLAVTRIELVRDVWNTVYRLTDRDGNRYALRINRPDWRDEQTVRGEVSWLEALTVDTGVLAPEPVAARDGGMVAAVTDPVDGRRRPVALFRWLPGRHQRSRPSTRTLELMGEMMAYLHRQAEGFRPAHGFIPTRLDRVWTFGHPDRICGEAPDPLFPPERRRRYQSAAREAQRALDALYADPTGLRLLHADVHLGNVKRTGDRLAILDFDDCLWGYPVQDIAISFRQLCRHPEPARLMAAFRAGYERVQPWPRVELRPFLWARALDLAALGAAAAFPASRYDVEAMLAETDRFIAG